MLRLALVGALPLLISSAFASISAGPTAPSSNATASGAPYPFHNTSAIVAPTGTGFSYSAGVSSTSAYGAGSPPASGVGSQASSVGVVSVASGGSECLPTVTETVSNVVTVTVSASVEAESTTYSSSTVLTAPYGNGTSTYAPYPTAYPTGVSTGTGLSFSSSAVGPYGNGTATAPLGTGTGATSLICETEVVSPLPVATGDLKRRRVVRQL